MHLSAKVWSCLSYLTNILTLSAVDEAGSQQPIGGHDIHVRPPTDDQLAALASQEAGYLKFPPPSWRPIENEYSNKTDVFYCEYPNFKIDEWEKCTESTNRGCWIRHKTNGTVYNINTDYEHIMPIGSVRNVFLNISDGKINADGMIFESGKLVNGSYPGPLIQAVSHLNIQILVVVKLLSPSSAGATHSTLQS